MTDTQAIVVRGARKEYSVRAQPPVLALHDVDLSVTEGEFVSIVGPSGCGKSTLLHAVGGLTALSRGTVSIFGEATNRPSESVGIAFQKSALLPWRTVLQNVLLQAEIRRLDKRILASRAHDLLHGVGLGGFENSYPNQLSGGMQQRASLCRALVHDPQVLLLDEPFGALDALTREQLNIDIQRIWLDTAKTVLFVTHDMEEACFLGDRVIVMSPRPGTIMQEVAVDFPRPRPLSLRRDERFQRTVGVVQDCLGKLGVFDEKVESK